MCWGSMKKMAVLSKFIDIFWESMNNMKSSVADEY